MRILIFILGIIGLLMLFVANGIRMMLGDAYCAIMLNGIFFLGFASCCAAWLFAVWRLKHLDENAGLLDEVDESVFIIDRDSRTIVCLNQATIDLLGFQREDLLNRPASHLFAGNETTVENLLAVDNRTPNHSKTQTISAMRKNGSLLPMQLTARPVCYRRSDCVMINGRDISEKVKSVEDQARLAAILESSTSGLCAANQEGIITNWNKAATNILGYRAKEMLGKPFMVLVKEENRKQRWEWYKTLLEGKVLPPYEGEVIHKTGKMVFIHIDASPIRDSKGKVVGVSVLFRDIQKNKATEKEYKESAKRLEIALQAAQLGLWDYDCVSGAVTIVSTPPGQKPPGEEPETGWNQSNLMGLIHPLDRQQTELELQYILKSEVDTQLNAKIRIRTNDGSYRWTQISGQVTERDENGRPTRMIGVSQDISKEMLERQREEGEKLRIKTLLAWSERTDASREDILDFTLKKAIELTGSNLGLIGQITEQGDQLEVSWPVHGIWPNNNVPLPPHKTTSQRFAVSGSPLWTKAIHTREPVAINTPNLDPKDQQFFGEHNPIERYMTVPILDEGRVAGIVIVANKNEGYATHDTIELQLLAQGMWSHLRKIEIENARKRAEQEKNIILDNLQEGVLCISQDQRVTYANRSACEMVGKPIEEIIGHSYDETCPSANHCDTTCIMHNVITKKQPCHKEITTTEGNRYDIKACPICNEEGEIFRVVETFCALAPESSPVSQHEATGSLGITSESTSTS